MQVLVLAWSAGGSAPPGRASVLADALVGAGHQVHLLTGAEQAVGGLDRRVVVHTVTDAPPIVPVGLRTATLDALAAGARTMAAAVAIVRDHDIDVVHAIGWQTAPVVRALAGQFATVVAQTSEAEQEATGAVGELAADLTSLADVVTRVGTGSGALPLGTSPRTTQGGRRPGPPPARGPLHLAGGGPDVTAAAVRAALAEPRRITRVWTRRPLAAALLDGDDLDDLARAFEHGVPVLAAEGAVADLVVEAGAGLRVPRSPATIAAAVDRLVADPARAAAMGAAAVAAADRHDRATLAASWNDLVADRPRPRLRPTG